MSARPMRESKKSRLIRSRITFPDRLLELRSLNCRRLPTVYTRAKWMALGCRPIFPGWAGTLAKTADISLAKTEDEAVKIRSNFHRAKLRYRIGLFLA